MSSDALDRLVTAAKRAAAAPAGELSDTEIADELVALRKLADVAEAAYLSRLAVFDARGLAETRQSLSTSSWVRHHLHVAPSETARSVRIARGVMGLPAVAAAMTEGVIRLPHAAAIVDGATMLGVEVVAGCQDALVEAARRDDPTRLRAALRGYGAAVDNPRAVKDAERRAEGRWLDIANTYDGTVSIQGVLGAEDGAIVKTAISALTTPGGADDARTAGQRRADALVEVCRRQLNIGTLPSQRGAAPHVTVITDLATIEHRIGGFGELTDGTVLRGDTVRRLACDATITRMITGPESMPLDVGRAQRTATAAQRKALRIRDGGCRFPGCDRPAEWCDVHHVRFWAHGGSTNVDEMTFLCRKHHTAVHEGGWQIRVIRPGRFSFTDPTGHSIPSQPRESTTHIMTQLVRHTRIPLSRAGPVTVPKTTGRSYVGDPA